MQSWKVRLGLMLTLLTMLIAVAVPASAQDFDECDFDGDDFVSEEEADDCGDAIEDFLPFGADVEVFCGDDDDLDGFFDEDGDDDGEDDDGDGFFDEDDDCDEDDLFYVVEF